VLIPRPETELIIDYCKEALHKDNKSNSTSSSVGLPWLDLGTGSGALAISLAKYFPITVVSRIYAIDKSSAAAAYARYNAERLLVEEGEKGRVTVLEGSWFEPLDDLKLDKNTINRDHSSSSLMLQLKVGGIVSNPPYIPQSVLTQGLQEEVERHEPRLALDGGGGLGVDSLEEICRGARRYLVPGGFIALETNGGEQAEYVAQVLLGGGEGGFEEVRVRKDLRGIGRFVTARRRREE
jgi:release factor glutamine methyltransferase